MSKEDLGPAPPKVPAKRKQLENAPAVWLAEWATNPDLPPSQRKRAQEERDRRKALSPEIHVGLIVADTGATAAQKNAVLRRLHRLEPIACHYPALDTNIAVRIIKKFIAEKYGRQTGVALHPYWVDRPGGLNELIKSSSIVLVVSAGSTPRGMIADALSYAKHRKIPTITIMPNGEEEQ